MSPVDVVLRSNPNSTSVDAPLAGVLDIIVDGVNVTARAGRTQGLTLLAELSHSMAALIRARTSRATAHLCSEGESWELGLEVDGSEVLLSVYRAGQCPEVAVHERRVNLADLQSALETALTEVLASGVPTGHRSILESARDQLAASRRSAKALPRGLALDRVSVKTGADLEIYASASFRIGASTNASPDDCVERADLHALLVPGEFRITKGRRSISLKRAQLFLLAERMIWLAEDTMDSWQAARPVFRRLSVEGIQIGVRRGPGDGPVALSLGETSVGGPNRTLTLQDIPTIDFVEGVAQFAEALSERFVVHDARQSSNLRLGVLLESARNLRERLSELRMDDGVTNAERESFRSYGLPSVAPTSDGTWRRGGAMRFVPRWVAAIPNVDLRSTFLYQKQLIIGSAREVASLSPGTGEIAWKIQSERAATVPTPVGLARLHADGRLRIHDLAGGAVRSVTRLAPRAGGGAAGALVNTPGLPQLLIVAEGDRAVTAVDLVTGDVRWRHRAPRPANFRLRRAGRLILMSGGDSALTALDVTTGETVWRVRDRLPFSGDIAVAGDSAFALSASAVGAARLHHIDLWSGVTHWTSFVEEQPVSGQQPLLSGDAVIVPCRDRRGVGVLAFDRTTGRHLWNHEPGLSGAATSWLSLEDSVVANSAAGTLLCLDSNTGEVRYNHVFSRQIEGDQPRRLQPVVRNGALFVPQHQVQVLRPDTGEIIGELPCDLIPDRLVVDESCNVYVAEESGHLAAYSVAPRLELVRH
jgi:outer membrane protein assembly factor BamB